MTAQPYTALAESISHCLCRDQYRLRQALRRLKKADSEGLEALQTMIQSAQEKVAARVAAIPRSLNYPESLPVVERRRDIVKAIAKHQVIIVCADTGSGKTTQLPKMCIEAGRGRTGMIGHTQPRRLAARTVANRLADELETPLGACVGYKVRFSDKISPNSLIKVMTDGILLAEIQRDRWLNQYDTIIIDEAHERSLNIDFLLGYLHRLLSHRPELKLIITSATIDPERIAKHFHAAPILTCSGRGYPVETRYAPLINDSNEDEDEGEGRDPLTQEQAIFNAAEALAAEGPGDILVFLPGERYIREAAEHIGKHQGQSRLLRHCEVVAVYARLPWSEQARIFAPHQQRRIVLATNVAETSLTVPGIRYVIDTGLARMSRYSAASKVQRLPIEPISKASADQRLGRCGREAPGICIRLYSEDDYQSRKDYTDPEILRTSLAAVILQMQAQSLGQVESFPFIDPPEGPAISAGYTLLAELGAVDDKKHLTKLGRTLAKLPLDPRLARMLVEANQENCLAEVLVITSALSIQDPRERPYEKREAADLAHAEYQSNQSDFLSFVNLWHFIQVQRAHLSHNQFRKFCQKKFLSFMRLREWRDIHQQLSAAVKELNFRLNDSEASYDHIHRALLSGLLDQVALKTDKNDYLATRNRNIALFPGSGLKKHRPKWIMAAEVMETTRRFARQVAAIKPEWIESQAKHLLVWSYYEPSWLRKKGYVGAFARITLYGLIINAKKRVNYTNVKPLEAREIFIRSALVEGNLDTRAAFFHHNLKLVDDVLALEEKQRRRDILIDPEELYNFYHARIPESISDHPSFEVWRKQYESEHPKGLFITQSGLMQYDPEHITEEAFPNHLDCDGITLPLSYHFSPGADNDGVTLTVPLALLNRVQPEVISYLVPGLLAERASELIRSLPKALRKNFVPAPDFARAALETLKPGKQSLPQALAVALARMTGVQVAPHDWNEAALPAHLRMRIAISNQGEIIACGRDLAPLKRQFQEKMEETLSASAESVFSRTGINRWDFGDLPEEIVFQRDGIDLKAYPALVSQDDDISLRLFATLKEAQAELFYGICALTELCMAKTLKVLRRKLPDIQAISLAYAAFGSATQIREDITRAALRQIIASHPLPRQQEAFAELLKECERTIAPTCAQIAADTLKALQAHTQIIRRVSGNLSLSWVEAVADMRDQIKHFFYPGWVTATPSAHLKRLPLYLQTMQKRLDSLNSAPDKDRRRRAEVLPLWEAFKTLPAPSHDSLKWPLYLRLRWQIEELRIATFAQELGTNAKVSVARLEAIFNELKKMDK